MTRRVFASPGIEPGSTLTLEIEKAVAGGRMLARHAGQVVLVWGAIPGERVRARIERVGRGVVYAETEEVLDASPDRRSTSSDWRCGGNVYAHITYDRQVRLKGEIIRDTFGRIGKFPLDETPMVIPSPESGYRTRARFHVRDGRLGFFREGTHHLCDPASTGQLLPGTLTWIADTERYLREDTLAGLVAVDLTENVPGTERACHLELEPGADEAPFSRLRGQTTVSDSLAVGADGVPPVLTLRHSPRSFFQSNRFLLEPLVRHVVASVGVGPVVDLYAGVGLFGLSLAAAGREDITLVEGDPASTADLAVNAQPFESRVRVERSSVESFLSKRRDQAPASEPAPRHTFIVDPPRTGLSQEAMSGIVRMSPHQIVYVSCDVATLSRDTRTLLDAGYELGSLKGLDMFPTTAHVETVATFSR